MRSELDKTRSIQPNPVLDHIDDDGLPGDVASPGRHKHSLRTKTTGVLSVDLVSDEGEGVVDKLKCSVACGVTLVVGKRNDDSD
jgi:hypothetical protein